MVIRLEFRRLAWLIVSSVAAGTVILQITGEMAWLGRSTIVLVWLAMLWLSGLVTVEEKQHLASWWNKLLASLRTR